MTGPQPPRQATEIENFVALALSRGVVDASTVSGMERAARRSLRRLRGAPATWE